MRLIGGNKELITYAVFDKIYDNERYLNLSRIYIWRRQKIDVGMLISLNHLRSNIYHEIK